MTHYRSISVQQVETPVHVSFLPSFRIKRPRPCLHNTIFPCKSRDFSDQHRRAEALAAVIHRLTNQRQTHRRLRLSSKTWPSSSSSLSLINAFLKSSNRRKPSRWHDVRHDAIATARTRYVVSSGAVEGEHEQSGNSCDRG
jgi:hypothetical protein